MKKLSIIVLGIVLCICFYLLPTQVKAAEKEGYLSYTISDGEVTITDCDENASGKIVIPETIEGYPVTAIGEGAFSPCSHITEIILPSGLKTIGDSAFAYVSFETVHIPDTVTYIGAGAFGAAKSLRKLPFLRA